ncbi:hypothetical protein KQ874_03295 [Mycoplasma sp. ES3157-GEN-MYC]|uniref:Lipoprotein n=1 Tax=Mycoplasma miroungigenitalium TaxID=754515 RepID=A0A6M4JA49_9MOLU|nr:hypothetical protein [Mycoplasma miroungigenitalium]MBU4690702.1 hypothetical protein [Mycoplasma miroungigenitalium]QJR43823.1 hypothetical protein HLA87_03490 [Mycoplasma miroungigenitalium]
MSKRYLSAILPLCVIPLTVLGCTTRQNIAKNVYVLEKNGVNDTYLNLPKTGGVWDYKNTLHDSLVGNYIFRYKFVGEAKYDYLNKYFEKNGIVGKFRKFGIIDKITIITNDGQIRLFDTDSEDEFKNPSKLTKVDINRGYKNYIYNLVSANPKSINSENFTNCLLNSKQVIFHIKSDLFWFDKGQKTNSKVTGLDVLKSIKAANLTRKNLKHLSLLGFDIKDSLVLNNNFSDSEFKFNMAEVTNVDLLLNELANNKIFTAYRDNEWSAGAYSLIINDLKHTEYIANLHQDLKKVILKYNPVGSVELQTHRIHLMNEYEQGLITSQTIDKFDNLQQNKYIRDFKSQINGVKLNIVQTKNNSSINVLLPRFKTLSNIGDIDLYDKFMYEFDGISKNESAFYNGRGFELRNNLQQIINKFTLNFNLYKTQYYDNLISPNALISNAKNTNYIRILDAIDHLNKSVIFTKSQKIEYYSQILKEDYYKKDSYLDLKIQLKSRWFDEIKNNINMLLNKFYHDYNLSSKQTITMIIPFDIKAFDFKTLEVINEIFSEIDERLIIKIVDTNDKTVDDYYEKITFNANNTIDFFIQLLTLDNKNFINSLPYIENMKFKYLIKFKEFFAEYFKINPQQILETVNNWEPADYESNMSEFAFKLHSKFNYYDIINMITELKILLTPTYNTKNNVDLDDFKYELVQSWIHKPTRDDNLIYFEDITVSKEDYEN